MVCWEIILKLCPQVSGVLINELFIKTNSSLTPGLLLIISTWRADHYTKLHEKTLESCKTCLNSYYKPITYKKLLGVDRHTDRQTKQSPETRSAPVIACLVYKLHVLIVINLLPPDWKWSYPETDNGISTKSYLLSANKLDYMLEWTDQQNIIFPRTDRLWTISRECFIKLPLQTIIFLHYWMIIRSKTSQSCSNKVTLNTTPVQVDWKTTHVLVKLKPYVFSVEENIDSNKMN